MVTTYFLNCIAGNLFHSKTDPAIPAQYYLGLSTTAPFVDGTNVTEPTSGAGYARVPLSSLGEPENGAVSNPYPITFEESTGDWGVVTHFVIYDQESDGNLLMYDALNDPKTVEAASIMTFRANSLALSVMNAE